MDKTELTPPPGNVFDLCERAVDFVRRALGLALDYTSETLPVLDHYLASVPRDKPALVDLVAGAAGAYFGEVARRTLGGTWTAESETPAEWSVRLTGDVSFSPVGFAAEILAAGRSTPHDGRFEVPQDLAADVEQALSERQVPEDEYYSLSGRLETLMLVVDVVMARRATRS